LTLAHDVTDAALRLRAAGPGDIPYILSVEAIPGHAERVGRFSAAEHRAKMESGAYLYVVAETAEGPAGFAVMRPGEAGSGTMCLHRIAVARTGTGVGSRFVAALCERAFADPEIDRLWLDVLPANAAARHVYARVGFREEGLMRKALRRPDGRREDLILMAMLREDRPAG